MNMPATITEVAELVPYFDDSNSQKRLYFSWRICGFSILEALQRVGIPKPMYDAWMIGEPDFQTMEAKVPELRNTAQEAVIQAEDDRNRRKLSAIDSKAFDAALDAGSIGLVDEQTFKHIQAAQGRYRSKVREILGVDSNQSLPSTMDEMVILMRRTSNARNENVENASDGKIIEADDSTTEISKT